MNILVSTISYVNTAKKGSEIYTTFAKRLAKDVKTKTPYDIIINTNRKDLFEEDERVTVRDEFFKDHVTHVGAFNQLLKFSALQQIDKKYDWLLYLDCDAGFKEAIILEKVNEYLQRMDSQGTDMIALRTNCTFESCLKEYYQNDRKHLFDDKFKFYGIRQEWAGSKFPSEHFLLLKNNDKLQKMADNFETLCYEFETQDKEYPVTFDMEAFEIGVAAKLAGYDMQEACGMFYNHHLNIGFNFNNFEKVKI